jgi:hypothetical protein
MQSSLSSDVIAERPRFQVLEQRPGLRQRALDALYGVNRQFLDLLCAQASTAPLQHPFTDPVRSRLANLSTGERLQMSRCCVLLVDAGFSDSRRWQGLKEAMSSAGPATIESRRQSEWLPAEEGRLMAQSTLLVAWSLLQWNPAEACVLLGMSRDTSAIIENFKVDELSIIAAHYPDWITPRWTQHPRAWLELIRFATTSASQNVAFGTLRCLQLSGGRSRRLDCYVDERP